MKRIAVIGADAGVIEPIGIAGGWAVRTYSGVVHRE